MNIKGVIFDFNGTLFFDNEKHVMAWNAISMLIRGHEISEEELHEKFNGTPNAQIIQYMMNNCASNEDVQRYSLLKEEYYRRFCQEDDKNFHLVDGVTQYFDSLKEHHIPFTIASASIKENIDFFRKSFHLDVWIDPQTIVYDNGNYHNKVQMFKDAAHLLGVDVSDILVFEDSYSGIKSAYEAGIQKIIVICPFDKAKDYQQLPGVIKVIEDFKNMNNDHI